MGPGPTRKHGLRRARRSRRDGAAGFTILDLAKA